MRLTVLQRPKTLPDTSAKTWFGILLLGLFTVLVEVKFNTRERPE